MPFIKYYCDDCKIERLIEEIIEGINQCFQDNIINVLPKKALYIENCLNYSYIKDILVKQAKKEDKNFIGLFCQS